MKNYYGILFFIAVVLSSCQQKTVENYISDGLLAFNNKDFSKAIEQFDAAIKKDGTLPEVYFNRGNAYALSGNLDAALADFDKAIDLKPDYAEAFLNRAYYIKERRGDLEGALADYSKSIEVSQNDNDAYALSNRSLVKMKMMEIAGAKEDVNRSIMLDPENAFAYRNRALIFIQEMKNDSACADLKKSIELGFGADHGGEVDSLIKIICQ